MFRMYLKNRSQRGFSRSQWRWVLDHHNLFIDSSILNPMDKRTERVMFAVACQVWFCWRTSFQSRTLIKPSPDPQKCSMLSLNQGLILHEIAWRDEWRVTHIWASISNDTESRESRESRRSQNDRISDDDNHFLSVIDSVVSLFLHQNVNQFYMQLTCKEVKEKLKKRST